MPNKQCSTCKYATFEEHLNTAPCKFPLPVIPFWNYYERLNDIEERSRTDGADCNAYQGKEEVDVLERVKDACNDMLKASRNVSFEKKYNDVHSKAYFAQQLLQLIDNQQKEVQHD